MHISRIDLYLVAKMEQAIILFFYLLFLNESFILNLFIVRIWKYDSKKKWNSICIDTSYSYKK